MTPPGLDALTGQVTQARTALTAYDELDALCREQKQAQDAAQLAGALAAKRRTQLEALDASLAAADTALAVLVDAPTRQLALQNQAAQLEARSTALDALAQRLADSQKQARQGPAGHRTPTAPPLPGRMKPAPGGMHWTGPFWTRRPVCWHRS